MVNMNTEECTEYWPEVSLWEIVYVQQWP